MSARGRGTKPIANDAYPTPPWAVIRLLEAVGDRLPTTGTWLEPAYGTGAICDAVEEFYGQQPMRWVGVELTGHGSSVIPGRYIHYGMDYTQETSRTDGSFGRWGGEPAFDVSITNCAFTYAFEYMQLGVLHAHQSLLLTRLNILEAGKKSGRLKWLSENTPDVYVLPDRPCFSHSITCLGCGFSYPCAWDAPSPTAPCSQLSANEWTICGATKYLRRAGTDATGYCWLHWDSSLLPRTSGLITHLAETPKSERVDRMVER